MGNVIASKCRICSFSKDFSFGGGRLNYLTNCPVPAINNLTKEFESVNYIIEKENKNYTFYSDEKLKGENPENKTFQNFDLLLNENNNFCPSCENFSLDFRITLFY